MRTMLAATLMIAAAVGSAMAQTPAPAPATNGSKPKPVATIAIRPGLQTPADTASAMAQAERTAIQSDLAWAGHYNGAINGEVSERMVGAIKAFQTDRGGKPTGVLNPQERGTLAEVAKKAHDNVGWKLVSDPVTGARLGLPLKLVPQQVSDANGAKWSSATGTIQILLSRRKEAEPSTAKLAAQEKKEPAGRKVEYSAVKPDFFVLSGTQGLKKFYVRGAFKDAEVRILTILYDQATEGTMEPVVIAMSSAFTPFPAGAQASGPPPRKAVEYSTGVVVGADGAILADRQAVDGCQAIVVDGLGRAEKVAEDKAHDLALLRVYGAQGLAPLGFGSGAAKPSVELFGIADPQSQGGGSAASSVRAQIAPVGAGRDLALTPAPGLGFSGAAAVDADGRFAGLALLKPVLFAGPANGAAPAQAMLVPADVVRGFLKDNAVPAAAAAAGDAKASVLRLICVRK
ncbi:peptidoglycan hydrolase-like protein with peptidoglycan-binding domain [Rhodopseudomonas rhenobacensis]|uniref:Peptidoglycan hydrolase-like protein with peptidoglycan-binding domain n=1 Tax=Rhodopseudomonas rhenobacensis TaxID=87461 RepID=A0A7W8E0B3_9BRAD|nr:serine protease [Rhodopseudomonas rhenobacensis]MBB5047721.1 peptidoglycan hydrolase-like protein with peptidoglycan-binding domain [Rhodopseudomonas rhenobacensis]